MRGTPDVIEFILIRVRIIPADAGNTNPKLG